MVARNCDSETSPATLSAIKVLDLKTRRYYAGVVHAASDGSLEAELPAGAVLLPGSVVRFSLSAAPFVPAHKMESAVVTEATRIGRHLRVALAAGMACAAA